MDEKDRELLSEILRAGGAAAQQGFDALVRWCWVDAWVNVLCYLAVAGLCAWCCLRLFRWVPDCDEEAKQIFRWIGVVVCLITLAIMTGSWLPGNLRELIAPQGEAVAYVLGHH